MNLVHTLLFFIRKNYYTADLLLAKKCLETLSKSSHKKVVIYNQGCISNHELQNIVRGYDLDCSILGDGTNIGITKGRQTCFQYIWRDSPAAKYISELHLDMIFSANWEKKLIDYLEQNEEPVISCGIIDSYGKCMNLSTSRNILPTSLKNWEPFLQSLQTNTIIGGFTHPCIHVNNILKEIGGYDLHLLTGNQCYEDDSLLLGYYLYYGTKVNWYPKINYNSVVYHGCATQRLGLDNGLQNYLGLLQQYGIMGQKYLSSLHYNSGQKNFFKNQYDFLSDYFI